MKVAGQVAIVTGGNRGIGEGFVRAFLDAGVTKVYVGARTKADAAHLADEFPGRAIPITLDVTNTDQVVAAARDCGDVSIVVNNAGAFLQQQLIGAPDMSFARAEMEVNYFGMLSMCRAFAPVLKANGGGAIVNVLSVGGIIAAPVMGGYSPSKFAAHALTTNIRAELAEQGTQVSALIVGSVDTRMAAHVKGQKEKPTDIGRAGILAIEKYITEMDTDFMAVTARAALARDPRSIERQMAAQLKMTEISTRR
ncbi:SDR family oxidoreductase [Govanella unica]|uniref:SDR family oxidoreductase n=1 Tax=Govanella unica TaxID=2975056 RepID=A0A9X3TX05_9PROT|nr:SDR family oxidoreductase [Govania unica]MDA5193506.1 SDR family oxidoreductase [Govania unica]